MSAIPHTGPGSCRGPDASAAAIDLCGARLVPDASGALHWPDEATLAVADLHLEKGSHFAGRGRLLPPYDTRATLDRLDAVMARLRPRRVLCLGDSFHDRSAAGRLGDADCERLRRLTSAAEWMWVAGNHDPEPPAAHLGGRVVAELRCGPLVFRHEAAPGAAGEVSGHFHPVAAVRLPGRRVRERCFACDGSQLILPAFGAYAGGLNVLDRAFAGILGRPFAAHVAVRGRVHRFPHTRLAPDAA